MADYNPLFLVTPPITLTLSAPCKEGDLLEVSGSGTVAPITPGATPSVKVVGIAGFAAAATALVTVYPRGSVHQSVADGTVTAGAQVATAVNANRQVVAAAAVTTPTPGDVVATRAILGIALTTASDNTKVTWMQT
jgi:hypothetical protein